MGVRLELACFVTNLPVFPCFSYVNDGDQHLFAYGKRVLYLKFAACKVI